MRWWIIVVILGAALVTACSAINSPGRFDDRNPYLEPKDTNAIDFFRMRWFGDEVWADQTQETDLIPQQPIVLDALLQPSDDAQVTWLGHATFLLQYDQMTVLTDPILSARASPLSFTGPERLTPAPVTIAELPPIDVVIISHNHYDHLDAETIEALGNQPLYVVPLALKEWFVDFGIAPERVIELDWWQSHQVGSMTLTATPSQHWSARSLFDKNESLWASWILDIDDWRVWFGGDTGYNPVQFVEIGRTFPDIDVALIPIGAYEPRWFMQPQHINPAEAVTVHQELGAAQSVAMHWGTYQLAAEGIQQTLDDLETSREAANVDKNTFQIMSIGETKRFTIPLLPRVSPATMP